jgi:hypothetical protein
MIETWRPVAGHEGLYEVSDLGRVKSVKRTLAIDSHNKGGRRAVRERILKPAVGRYCTVGLGKNGVTQHRAVHTLVLEAFVGPCPIGMQARHFPRDTTNNRLDNLSWGTATQNQADRFTHGTDDIGRAKPRKTTQEIDDAIRAEYALPTGINRYGHGKVTQRQLADRYGLSLSCINTILHKHRKGG